MTSQRRPPLVPKSCTYPAFWGSSETGKHQAKSSWPYSLPSRSRQGQKRLGRTLWNHSLVTNAADNDGLRLELDRDPKALDVEVLDRGLAQFNRSSPLGGDRVKVALAVWLRRGGRVLGGAYGNTHSYGWLYLSTFWVDEEVRGQGWGRRLIEHFEAEGIERGCRGAWVETYGFQAPLFYERVGYREFGRLERLPTQFSASLLGEAPLLVRPTELTQNSMRHPDPASWGMCARDTQDTSEPVSWDHGRWNAEEWRP